MTAAARKAAEDRFIAAVRAEHPGASERDIQRMAAAARALFYDELSAAGVAARQARARATVADLRARAAEQRAADMRLDAARAVA